MSDSKTANFEYDFYAFLIKVSGNPAMLKMNAGELKTLLDKLRLLNDTVLTQTILGTMCYLVKNTSRIQPNIAAAIGEIERTIYQFGRMTESERLNALRGIKSSILNNSNGLPSETYVNRVKTSDKQTKAVIDFIKG